MEKFSSKSVRELQDYLKSRGVCFNNIRKPELVELCEIATSVNIEVDPDGLVEDRFEILSAKLKTDSGEILTSPQLIDGSDDISLMPAISIFDIYNYLVSFDEFDHAKLRSYNKLEGYTMFQDGYVIDLKSVKYDDEYVGLRSKVKPRTCDKDPVSKLGHYNSWILMKLNDGGSVKSAYCSCKGGMDGCCRHVIATLFEVLDYLQDFGKRSCTSEPCKWVRRSSQSNQMSQPIPVTELNTSILQTSSNIARPCNFPPLPDTFQKPDPNLFLDRVRTLYPKACILDTTFTRGDQADTTPTLELLTPQEKLSSFVNSHICLVENCLCSKIFLECNLCYSEEERAHIECSTRGQTNNNNWHNMRKGLVTASNFKLICSSTNQTKTGENLLKDPFAHTGLPPAILFGRRYEDKARNMFLKAHRFRHRQCQLSVPGLVMFMEDAFSFLGCSPDGIIDCKICGKFLLEVKCSFKYKSVHPRTALKLSAICQDDENGILRMKSTHPYFFQIQGQMAVTEILTCVMVYYTHKGICTVDIDFDEAFWKQCKSTLLSFYNNSYFPLLKSKVTN